MSKPTPKLKAQQDAFMEVYEDGVFQKNLQKRALFMSKNSEIAELAYSDALLSFVRRLFKEERLILEDPNKKGAYKSQMEALWYATVMFNIINRLTKRNFIKVQYSKIAYKLKSVLDEAYHELNLNDLESGALEVLTQPQREVFVLKVDKGMRYSEIAKITQNSIGGVTSLMNVSKRKLIEYHVFVPNFEKIKSGEMTLDTAWIKYGKKKEMTFKKYYKIWRNAI